MTAGEVLTIRVRVMIVETTTIMDDSLEMIIMNNSIVVGMKRRTTITIAIAITVIIAIAGREMAVAAALSR